MKRFLLSGLLLLFGSSVYAQYSNSSVYRFLETPPHARAAAVGGNHTGLYKADPSLFYLNPAYLTPESSKKVSATFVNYLSDVRIGFANGAYDLEGIGTLGFGIRYAGYGDLEELDVNGDRVGDLRASDLSFTTAMSTKLSDRLSAGAGIDLVHSVYHTYSSSAVMVSGGLYYVDEERHFSAGMSFRNLGDQLSYYNEVAEDLPFDLSAGFSKKPDNFPFLLTLTLRQLTNWDMKVAGETEDPSFLSNLARHTIMGGEAELGENVTFRLGYNHLVNEQIGSDSAIDLSGFSIGLGLNVRGIEIDLSRNSYSDIGGIVQISISSQLR